MRYSALKVMKEALTGHTGWKPAWRDVDPQPAYDYVIIGGGVMGLQLPITWQRFSNNPVLLLWKKVGLGAATLVATRQLSDPIICSTGTSHFMSFP